MVNRGAWYEEGDRHNQSDFDACDNMLGSAQTDVCTGQHTEACGRQASFGPGKIVGNAFVLTRNLPDLRDVLPNANYASDLSMLARCPFCASAECTVLQALKLPQSAAPRPHPLTLDAKPGVTHNCGVLYSLTFRFECNSDCTSIPVLCGVLRRARWFFDPDIGTRAPNTNTRAVRKTNDVGGLANPASFQTSAPSGRWRICRITSNTSQLHPHSATAASHCALEYHAKRFFEVHTRICTRRRLSCCGCHCGAHGCKCHRTARQPRPSVRAAQPRTPLEGVAVLRPVTGLASLALPGLPHGGELQGLQAPTLRQPRSRKARARRS